MRTQGIEMQLGSIAAPADIAVEILRSPRTEDRASHPGATRCRRRMPRCCRSARPYWKSRLNQTERSARKLDLAAVVGEAVLELHVHRAAERVQAEHRVRAFQIDLVDRQIGDQVQIDGVAERLIEADAVDVDGETLRACPAAAMRRSHDRGTSAGYGLPEAEFRVTPPTCWFNEFTRLGVPWRERSLLFSTRVQILTEAVQAF